MTMIRLLPLILSTIMVGEAGWTVQIEHQPIEIVPADEQYQETYYEPVYYEPETYYEEPETEAYYEDTTPDDDWTYLGCVRVTGYTWTGNTCANGCYPTSGYTVACNDLPIGTVVYIEGIGYRTVEDRGGMTRGTYWMDVYFDSVQECYAITGEYDAWIVEP